MKLIDKDAALAEIENRIKSANNDVKIGAIESLIISKTLNGFKSFLNTLEVKEVQKEPVSKDLEGAATKYAEKKCFLDNAVLTDGEMLIAKAKQRFDFYNLATAFEDGANWQKQQMERYRIEHCNSLTNEQAELEETFVSSHVEKNNRVPTFIDAIEYGIEYCKQQMMAKAVDVTIAIPYQNGYGGYSQIVDSKEALPFGEKVKVIVIKED